MTWVYIFQWTSEPKSQLFVVCLFVFEAWIILGIIWSPWLCLGFQFHIRVHHTAGWGLDIDGSEERKMPRADWSGVTLPWRITHKDAGKLAWIRSRWQCRLLPLWPCQQTFLLSQRFQLTNLANFAGICMVTLLCCWISVKSVHYVILLTLEWALEMDFVVKADWSNCNIFCTNKFEIVVLFILCPMLLSEWNSIQFIYVQ